jgi:hypothetical protein
VDDQVKERIGLWWRGRIPGALWAGYYSWLDAMDKLGVTGLAPIYGQQAVARNASWWWAFSQFAILTERPTVLHRDNQGRLHCESGPAIAWPDGWGIHAWHGTRVPADLITPGWGAKTILREPNAETRRCAIERMGWPEFIKTASLKQVGEAVPDPGNPGEDLALYDVPSKIYGTPVRVLVCTNATVERDGSRHKFGLTVPASITDPVSAAGWTFNLNPSQYAQLARAC